LPKIAVAAGCQSLWPNTEPSADQHDHCRTLRQFATTATPGAKSCSGSCRTAMVPSAWGESRGHPETSRSQNSDHVRWRPSRPPALAPLGILAPPERLASRRADATRALQAPILSRPLAQSSPVRTPCRLANRPASPMSLETGHTEASLTEASLTEDCCPRNRAPQLGNTANEQQRLSPLCEPPCPIQAPAFPVVPANCQPVPKIAELSAVAPSVARPVVTRWVNSRAQSLGRTRRTLSASPEVVQRDFLEFESVESVSVESVSVESVSVESVSVESVSVESVPPRHSRQGPEVSKILFSSSSNLAPASYGGPSNDLILPVLRTVSIPASLFRQIFLSPPAFACPLSPWWHPPHIHC